VAIFLFGILIIPKPFGEGVNLKRVFTVESRFIDYSKAIELWKKKPIFGYGYNHIRSLKQEMVSHAGASFHSSYLIMLVSGGIIGLFLFLAILYKISTVNSFSHYAVLFLGILSLSDNILLHPFVIFLTGIFILLYNVENKNPNS
jgi:O-antigen ligase